MDTRFSIHNLHHEDIQYFVQNDPQLRRLRNTPLVFRFPLIDELPDSTPGIYIVTGGRQVGKTTLLKLWMQHLLVERKLEASQISFITGDIIDDYQQLLRICQSIIDDYLRVLIIDEITYIKEWDRAIKFLADSGALENITLILTGSDSTVLKEARLRLPGRRGLADQHEFILWPLTFKESVQLKYPKVNLNDDSFLEQQWLEYLHHGGYLTAINQFVERQTIPKATLDTYSDWIRGDFLKRGKNENTLREVVASLQKRQGSQVTWNALAKELSVEHPVTLASYVGLLSLMSVVHVQSAIDQNSLKAAPKKAKKIQFEDPFVYHALHAWINPSEDPFSKQISKVQSNSVLASVLSEAIATTHVLRRSEVFYIKAEGEVDIATVQAGKIIPVEVKWTKQLRRKDLKQLSKYSNATIWSKSKNDSIDTIPNIFLPRALLDY